MLNVLIVTLETLTYNHLMEIEFPVFIYFIFFFHISLSDPFIKYHCLSCASKQILYMALSTFNHFSLCTFESNKRFNRSDRATRVVFRCARNENYVLAHKNECKHWTQLLSFSEKKFQEISILNGTASAKSKTTFSTIAYTLSLVNNLSTRVKCSFSLYLYIKFS